MSDLINENNDYIDINNFNLNLLKLMELDEDSEDGKTCLISNEKLETYCITLSCNHSFNYKHIYKEAIKQKTMFNSLETTKLDSHQIKCPYCRHITNNLLPPRQGFNKINGVNWPLKYCLFTKKCGYIFLSGKKKNTSCNKNCIGDYCPGHEKIMKKRKLKEYQKSHKKKKQQTKKLENSNNKLYYYNNQTNMTVKQLKQYCKSQGIKKYSNLSKNKIVSLIDSHITHKKKQLENTIIVKKHSNSNNLENKIITI
tara:strand:+ start:1221 stop:1985 length:765 start_codon:yes stop_codon:yes gene_type:complete